ncbi:hypothetical protein EVAR_11357_1 [Eumeta japonica]|uniref:Uncharacterized protein n=1 Tax=Eumeta variegata TaxID=151549 RepID=A0A4C1U1A3_EUMVA|nr:hypothetical protein EVAR_11357_1 [Eumeta japonica]
MRSLKILVFTLLAVVGAQETCRSVDEEPYIRFGTKTAYSYANTQMPQNDHGVPDVAYLQLVVPDDFRHFWKASQQV